MGKFDPFTNRLCRDIRNELSESLVASIVAGDVSPCRAVNEKYSAIMLDTECRDYINTRITRYQAVMTQIQATGIRSDDFYAIAVLLWDHELFFEVHELLETKWHVSQGIERSVIQSLIRTAGTYVHLTLGRMNAARKIGAKALAGLKANREAIPDGIDVDLLIHKLETLDPVPPKLSGSSPLLRDIQSSPETPMHRPGRCKKATWELTYISISEIN